MRFVDSIFAKLLKPIDRRAFKKIVDRHRGDAYDKTFKSWDHLVALVYAQLAGIVGLRALETGFNATRTIIVIWAPASSPAPPCRMRTPAVRSRFLPRASCCWRRPRIGKRGRRARRWSS